MEPTNRSHPISNIGKHFLGVIILAMRWLLLVGSFKLQVSFAKKPYKRDHILQKRPMIQTQCLHVYVYTNK